MRQSNEQPVEELLNGGFVVCEFWRDSRDL
jgi:hypothetical protein